MSIKLNSIKTSDLIPYARNARTHSAEQVAQIAASIKEFGFINPVIIDKDNGIIAGHGRVMAARKLGMAEVPCVEVAHLTEAQKKAYILADNQLAMNAGWDREMLRLEIEDLSLCFNLDAIGFSKHEIDGLLASIDFEDPNEVEKEEKSSKKIIICPKCGFEYEQK